MDCTSVGSPPAAAAAAAEAPACSSKELQRLAQLNKWRGYTWLLYKSGPSGKMVEQLL